MTQRQFRFVKEYKADGNGIAAAIRAGYSETSAKETACRLLKDPQIRALLSCGDEEELGQRVLRELEAVAFKAGSDSGKLRALEMLGKISGLFDTGGRHLPPVTIVDDL